LRKKSKTRMGNGGNLHVLGKGGCCREKGEGNRRMFHVCKKKKEKTACAVIFFFWSGGGKKKKKGRSSPVCKGKRGQNPMVFFS